MARALTIGLPRCSHFWNFTWLIRPWFCGIFCFYCFSWTQCFCTARICLKETFLISLRFSFFFKKKRRRLNYQHDHEACWEKSTVLRNVHKVYDCFVKTRRRRGRPYITLKHTPQQSRVWRNTWQHVLMILHATSLITVASPETNPSPDYTQTSMATHSFV